MAKYILIKGWKQGVHRGAISVMDFFRKHRGLSLSEGKRIADRFADEGGLTLPLEDPMPAWVSALSAEQIDYEIYEA